MRRPPRRPRPAVLGRAYDWQQPGDDPPRERKRPGPEEAEAPEKMSFRGDSSDLSPASPKPQRRRPVITTAERRKRRENATAVLPRLGDLLHDYRVNDTKAAHVTLWLREDYRIEWWPGTASWHDPIRGRMRGSLSDLVGFLREAREGGR